jgi:hypothetical protein
VHAASVLPSHADHVDEVESIYRALLTPPAPRPASAPAGSAPAPSPG